MQVTNQEVLDITKGFLEGALAAEGLDDIGKCMDDSKDLVADAQKTYTDCKDGSIFTKAKCVEDISALIKDIIAATSKCKALKDDMAKLAEMAAVFSNPASFIWHVGKDMLVNGRAIGKEINAAIKAYKNE